MNATRSESPRQRLGNCRSPALKISRLFVCFVGRKISPRGERLQRLQKIEMRVRTFQFHPVITSARSNEEVVGWCAFARLAAAVGQLASALPDLIIDRQFGYALFVLAKGRAFLFGADACPKLQSHDRAPGRKPNC